MKGESREEGGEEKGEGRRKERRENKDLDKCCAAPTVAG
jgi:hypothetical protein